MPSQLRLRATLRSLRVSSTTPPVQPLGAVPGDEPNGASIIDDEPPIASEDGGMSGGSDSDARHPAPKRKRASQQRRSVSASVSSGLAPNPTDENVATSLPVEVGPSPQATAAHALPTVTRLVEPLHQPADTEAAARDGKRAGRTKIFLNGFEFTRARVTSVKITYRCSFYRSQACPARLIFYSSMMDYDFENMIAHTCMPPSQVRERLCDGAKHLTLRLIMQREVDALAIAGAMTPRQIWFEVSNKFLASQPENTVITAMSMNQVIKRVQNTRAGHFGSDMHGRVEVPPMSLVRNTKLSFFQFHHVWYNQHLRGENKLDRVIGWAHPALLTLLRYSSISLFIDGTFRCVPAKFKLCIVIMVYDKGTKLYVPVCYVLAVSKTYEAYWNVMQYAADACGQRLKPKGVVCDFEAPLIGAVSEWFEGANIIGCYFHFKQACQRRMVKYRIPRAEVSIAMERGVLDMLTVVDRAKVQYQGVLWVKRTIKERCAEGGISYSVAKWREFWAYFQRTWIRMHPPAIWNVHGINRSLVARTNNPLERSHRELNAAFPTPHPSLPRFVHTIEEISRRYVQLREAITRGTGEPPRRQTTLNLPTAIVLPDAIDDDSDLEIEADAPGAEEVDPSSDLSGTEDEADADADFSYEYSDVEE